MLANESSVEWGSLGDALRYCPTFKNATCFGRWAKAHPTLLIRGKSQTVCSAHPTLLQSFGAQRAAGIKYGVTGISKSFSRDCLLTLGKGVLY